MRPYVAAAFALTLAACSNGQFNPIVDAAVNEILPGERAPQGAPETPPRGPVTRAELTRADVATIRGKLPQDKRPSMFFAASDNGGYVTYSSSFRQTLTLRGTQITGSRGFGWDLLSATSSRPDPLVTPIPPGRWPASVTRSYEFHAFAPQGRIETFTCRFEYGQVREIEIMEVRHRGVEIAEICENDTRSFENLHFADVNTGFVWRSLQWLGPQQGVIDIEVVIPFTGRRT
ncbi:hypothetical protein CNY89_02530 [Amaricoccus sp. HAR-UPW-R2A-40]|nr:hypothetical protein CNY89_02530 [Amaricoccus sp. HAR-UPW-R2A-40]